MSTWVYDGVRHEFDEAGVERICNITYHARRFPRREEFWSMGSTIQQWTDFTIEYANYPNPSGLSPLRRALIQSFRERCPDWETSESRRWDKVQLELQRSCVPVETAPVRDWRDIERWLFDARLQRQPYYALCLSYQQDRTLFLTHEDHQKLMDETAASVSANVDQQCVIGE